MKIHRSQADALFSLFIRRRDKWTCRRCLKPFPEGAQNLHSAHIFSRRHWSTRHDPTNALSLCFTCHQYCGENPIEFARWCDKKFGAEAMDRLFALSHRVVKKSNSDEKLRVMALKQMLDRL